MVDITLYCWGLPQGWTDHGEPGVVTCRRQPIVEVSRTRMAPGGGGVLTQATLPYCPTCLHNMQTDPNVIVHHVENLWGATAPEDRRTEVRPDSPGRRVGDGIAL